MIKLKVLRGAAQGLEVETNARQISLGRADDCTIVIPNSYVSRLHGDIQLVDGKYRYRDLNSKHGTILRRSGKEEPVRELALRVGDELDLGGFGNVVRVAGIGVEGVAKEERALKITHRQKGDSLAPQDLLTDDSRALRLMVEFDSRLLSAECTVERQFYEALIDYITRILHHLDYVAILEWSDGHLRPYDFRLGTPEGKVRLSTSIIALVREEQRGVIYEVEQETTVAGGNRQLPISDESRVVDQRFAGDRTGVCLPFQTAPGPQRFLQFERARDAGRLRQSHLDLAAAMVSRVSDRVQNLNLVRQNQRLHLNASLGLFAGMMGHDIKNYLFYSKKLSEIQDEPLSAHPGIIKGVERARKLAQGMKDLYAPGNQPIASFPLEGLLQSIANEFASLFGGTCDFEFEAAAGLAEITTNEDLLSRVVWNLVMNAYHANENRRATITARPYVRLSATADGQDVTIKIADNAGGLGPQTFDYLLRSFSLIRSAFEVERDIIDLVTEFNAMRGYTNSIGLFFTGMAVNSLRGRVDVETGAQGTAFTVALPARIDSLWRLMRL
ncbi:MAG: FHA domain-containing protein [Candidatus Hydrogenedentes bacterium]|nr:FHA domain-containing protein [Candidatus Hydrogenedentota bacterium]